MSHSSIVNDYLTKQLYIEHSIVTYRSLSRALSIHVNVAKRELATFHESSPSKSYATYLVCGDVRPQGRIPTESDKEDAMDVDMAEGEFGDADYADEEDESVNVPELRMELVGEAGLADAKLRFSRVSNTHIYALSPAPIRDAGLFTSSLQSIYDKDASGGAALAEKVGRVVGANIIVPAPLAGGKSKPTRLETNPSLKIQQPELKLPSLKPAPPVMEDKASTAPSNKSANKPKATGKLDFSHAKPKGQVKKEEGVIKTGLPQEDAAIKPDLSNDANASSSSRAPKIGPPKKKPGQGDGAKKMVSSAKSETHAAPILSAETSQRGAKRKPADWLLSSEDESMNASDYARDSPPPPPVSPLKAVRATKRGVVLSDEDEDNDDDDNLAPKRFTAKAKTKAKPHPVLSDGENEELKAMMNLDDDQVIHARGRRGTTPPETDDDRATDKDDTEGEDGMIEDVIDDAPKPKRKRKEKKVIPVGKNGLPKRRIVKTRKTKDAKGFTVAEDYSEYESVDEAEAEPNPDPKKGAKGKKMAVDVSASAADTKAKPKTKIKPNEPAPRRTESSSSLASTKGTTGQKNLMNFFGKPGKK